MTNFIKKHLKEFAANNKNTNLQIIGSLADGTPLQSSDPETLQSSSRFLLGWREIAKQNATNNTKNPVADEMSALDYVHNYFLNHILQKGFQEYDDEREYFVDDPVRSGSKIYKSLTNNNTGNPISDQDFWEMIANFDNNVKFINQESDFPTPISNIITLEDGKHYILSDTVTISAANRFVIPSNANIKISSVSIFSYKLQYNSGTNTLFTASSGGSLYLDNIQLIGNSLATLADFDNGALLFFNSVQTFSWGNLGTIRGGMLSFNVGHFNYNNSFSFTTRTDMASLATTVRLDGTFFRSITTNPTGNVIDVDDENLDRIIINGGGSEAGSNETIFNISNDLETTLQGLVVRGFDVTGDPSAIFAANSLNQSFINSVFANNLKIPDSISFSKSSFLGNSALTTISVIGTPVPINVNVNYLLELPERILCQDVVTFDNVTNTLNTTFNHGLSTNDRVFLTPDSYPGVLPSELDGDTKYYVINPTATSYQLSLTESGSVIDFTDNGSGTNYYRHSAGVSRSGEVIYLGNEDVKMNIGGWVSLLANSGTPRQMRASIMKIDDSHAITEDSIGAKVTADNTTPQSSVIANIVKLSKGEGIVIYVRNDSAIINIVAEEFLLILNKS